MTTTREADVAEQKLTETEQAFVDQELRWARVREPIRVAPGHTLRRAVSR
jgi:hypothetical protein